MVSLGGPNRLASLLLWRGQAPARTLRAARLSEFYRYAQTQKRGSAELLGTPVGQVVGQMNKVRSVKQVVQGLVDEYIDALGRVSDLLDRVAAD